MGKRGVEAAAGMMSGDATLMGCCCCCCCWCCAWLIIGCDTGEAIVTGDAIDTLFIGTGDIIAAPADTVRAGDKAAAEASAGDAADTVGGMSYF